MSELTNDELKALYRDMLRIRKVEQKIESLYMEDNMKTPIHLYIGQEAISAGVCANMTNDDPMFTTYRSHGQYLSKGGDLRRMIAELHCKETGCSGGRGGSMHLIDLSVGHYGSSAIVGGGLPVATGMAFAKKMKNEPHVTVTFFGDGASEEGIFWESLQYAMLKKLPIVFVLENNGWAVCSRNEVRKVGENVFHQADPAHLFTAKINGNDVLEVHDTAKRAIEHARDGKGPAFIECVTYRVRGHAGSGSDTKLGHRTDEEVAEHEADCPIARFEKILREDSVIDDAWLDELNAEIDTEIEEAFDYAVASPLPVGDDLMKNIYRD